MDSTLPVDHKNDLARASIDVDNDFVDQCPNDPLLQTCIGFWTIPDSFQLGCQAHEFIMLNRNCPRLVVGVLLDARFQCPNTLERLIPTSFQFVGNQAIVRIGPVILLMHTLRRIAGGFQVPPQRLQDFILSAPFFFAREHGRFYSRRLHHAQELAADSRIDRRTAEGNTLRLVTVQPSPVTRIADNVVTPTRVLHGQLPAATPTAQQPTQQRRTVLGRTGLFMAADVAGDHRLDLLKLVPADVALMRVRNKRQAIAPGTSAGSRDGARHSRNDSLALSFRTHTHRHRPDASASGTASHNTDSSR